MVAILLGIVLAAPVAAKAPATKAWEQEPNSFIGFRFGEPLSTQMAECPQRSGERLWTEYRAYDTERMLKENLRDCFKMVSRDEAEPQKPPYIGEIGIYRLSIGLADSSVGRVSFDLSRLKWMNMLDLLEARYGKAHESGNETYTTTGGQVVKGNTYKWRGDSVTVEFSEYGSNKLDSSVSAYTKRWIDYVKRLSLEHAQKNKGKL